MATAKKSSLKSSFSPEKLRRRFTTIVMFDLRDSEFRPIEKNRVELGPSEKPYGTREVQKALARKFRVAEDSVHVGQFRRAPNRENLMYAVVCTCHHGPSTRHVFVQDNQRGSEYPACICVDVNTSVQDFFCCLDLQPDQHCLFLNGRVVDPETHQVSEWQPVTFLQKICRQNIRVTLSYNAGPDVKFLFYLPVQNTDSVAEIRQRFLSRHAEHLKSEGKEVSFSTGSRILPDRCVPYIFVLTSDGEVLSEALTLPLHVHIHTAQSVPVHVTFCDDEFIIFVPRGTSFRGLKSKIAKAMGELPWSLEYFAFPEAPALNQVVENASRPGQPCTVRVVRGIMIDVNIDVESPNVTGQECVQVQIYPEEPLDALRKSLAERLTVSPCCLWFHDKENAIPPTDSPVAEYLQNDGNGEQLTLKARIHPRCVVLQIVCKKFETVDRLWVDNADQKTCHQLLQYLQQSMGAHAQRRVVAYFGARRIEENCPLSLTAAGLDNQSRVRVHLSSKGAHVQEVPPPYHQRFVDSSTGAFEREYFLIINGVPHFTRNIPATSYQHPREESVSGFSPLTTHFFDKVSAPPLAIAAPEGDAVAGSEPCESEDLSGAPCGPAKKTISRSNSQTEGRSVGIIRPSVPSQTVHRLQPLPNTRDIVYQAPAPSWQYFPNARPNLQVASVKPNQRSSSDFIEEFASTERGETPDSVLAATRSEAASPSLIAPAGSHPVALPPEPDQPPLSLLQAPAPVPAPHDLTNASRPSLDMVPYNPAPGHRSDEISAAFPWHHPQGREPQGLSANQLTAIGHPGTSPIVLRTVTCQQTEVRLPSDLTTEQLQAVAEIACARTAGLTPPQHASLVPATPRQNDPLDAAFIHVARTIGANDWNKLSSGLGLSLKDLEDIRHEFPGDMVMQIRRGLDKWRQRMGSAATVQTLKSALIANQLVDLAEELRDNDVS